MGLECGADQPAEEEVPKAHCRSLFHYVFLSSKAMHRRYQWWQPSGEDLLVQSIRMSSAVILLYWLISLYARISKKTGGRVQ
jgi:hypothetical protein